jgi:hypothetical protein
VVYPGISLEELQEITKELIQHGRSPQRDFNPALPEYEAGVLAPRFRRFSLVVMLTGYYFLFWYL